MIVALVIILGVICGVSSIAGLVLLGYIGATHKDDPGGLYKPIITLAAIAITSGIGVLTLIVIDSFGVN